MSQNVTTTAKPEGVDWEMISTVVQWIGTVIGIILNISPIINFWNVLTGKKDVNTIPQLMLVFNILCSMLWYVYWKRQDVFVAGFSAQIGTILSIIFATVYVFVISEKKCGRFALYGFLVLDLSFQLYYTLMYILPDYRIIGTIAMVVNIINYAAPGQNIITVIKTGNYDLIPIAPTFVGSLCSISWLTFGLIKQDINCIVPNSLGLVFSALNFSIWTYFYCKGEKKEGKNEKLNGDEGTELQKSED